MSICKLDANENPYNLPQHLKNKITKKVKKLNFNRYPDSEANCLKQKLAEYTSQKKKNIMVGNGSDELLSFLMKCFLDNDKKALVSVPTFSMYQFYAQTFGEGVVRVKLKDDLSQDWTNLYLESKRNEVGIIVLCSPNNPTGKIIDIDQLQKLLEKTDKPVLVDEAYSEFSGKTCLNLIDEYPNLIITRTFSKSFCLAGLRIGYLVADISLIEKLEEIRSPYNTGSLSQEIAYQVLDSIDVFQKQWKKIRKSRDRLFKKMNKINGVTPYPSSANFIMFHTEKPEKKIYQKLKKEKIIIRYFSNLSRGGDTLRVTVGKKEEIDLFLQALQKIIEEESYD